MSKITFHNTMNRTITSIFLSAALVLTLNSCNSNEDSTLESTPESTPTKEAAPQAQEAAATQHTFTPEEIQARKERKESIQAESKRLREENPVLASEYNTTSVYKYVITSPEFSIFAKLLKASDLSKTMHGSKMTAFIPNNEAFSKVDQGILHKIFKPAKKDALNKFINNHICMPAIGVEKLGSAVGLSDGNGNEIKVSNETVLSVNGAEVIKKDITTKSGNIIQIKLPIGFPTSL